MSLSACRKCTSLFQPYREDAQLCDRCTAFADMLVLLNALTAWRARVDVLGGDTSAADQLGALIDRAAALAERAGVL